MQLIDELVCAKSKLEKNVDSRTRFRVFSLVWMWISTCCKNMRTKLWKFCLITDIMNANTVCLEYWSWIVISKGVVGLALISVTWSEQHWYTILGLAPRAKKKLNLKLIGYSLSELAYICWNASVTLGLQKWIDVWLRVTWN